MKKKVLLIFIVSVLLFVSGCGKKEETKKENDNIKENTTINDNKNDETETDISNMDKLTCHVNNNDSTQDITFYSTDNIVKYMEVSSTMEVSADQIDMTVSAGNAMKDTFKETYGMEVEYTKISDTTIKFVGRFNIKELIKSDLMKTTLKEYIDTDAFENLDKDALAEAMTVDLLKNSIPSNAVCE